MSPLSPNYPTLYVYLNRYWIFCLHCGSVALFNACIFTVAYFDADTSDYRDELVRLDWGHCECLPQVPHRIVLTDDCFSLILSLT